MIQSRSARKVDALKVYDIDSNKAKKGKCIVKYCRNSPVSGSRLCSKHKHQRRKVNDPIGYYFDIARQNARARKIPFEIDKKYFTKLVLATDYMKKGGRDNSSLTLERVNNNKGYIKGNVKIISFEQNREKGDDAPF